MNLHDNNYHLSRCASIELTSHFHRRVRDGGTSVARFLSILPANCTTTSFPFASVLNEK